MRTKIEENQRSERPFLAKKCFWVDFWRPSGSPGASRDVPGASQNPLKFSAIASCVSKLARTAPREAPGRPRGTPQAPPGHNFGSILHIKKRRKMQQNDKEASQKTFEKLAIVVTNRTLRRRAASEPAPRNAHPQLPRRPPAQLFKFS